MGSGSVGEVALDVVLNHNFSGITNIAKKAGAAIAAAFSVKKLIDFGKECIELGSDLEEVQNVVDVTFPSMSAKVDEFAKSAASSFGMSETMAKKYTGTFGAMAKAFGFSESAAYDMGTTLTGLAGDVASFYNLSQDEAYTKLKSVFTGETESLKDLGVVMTQSALDSYALANGFGKTTAAMTEAEKVSLRYAFVQDRLSAAAGDFSRTSGSWANQVRILSLQFDSLKATIGQGLINVFTPVIKVINAVIGKLSVLAGMFKSFTDMLAGKKSSAIADAGSVAEKSFAGASEAADGLSESTAGAGGAAKKAAKEMRALMGFDQIQKIGSESSSDGGGSGGSGAAGIGAGVADAAGGEQETPIDESQFRWLDAVKNKISELATIWKNGFVAGIGDAGPKIEDIKTKIGSIKQSLTSIFTDSEVLGAANGWVNSVTFAFGQVTGSVASIGLTIAQNLTGGIASYLSSNAGRIKEYLVSMFDIGAKTAEIAGNFSAAFANIFSAFGGENGQQLTANLIGMFSDAFMGVTELAANIGLDIINVITKPFIDNQDGLRTALDGFLGVAATVCGTVKDTISNTFSTIMTVYDEHIKPYYDAIANGLSELANSFLEFWNTNVQPVMDSMAEKFDSVMSEHIQPMLDKAIELVGSIADALKALWENVLVPVINWIIENILPVLLPIIDTLYQGVLTAFGCIADLIGGLIDNIKGIIDFIVGVFTGDWEKAWGGIKTIVSGIMDQIKAIINLVITVIKTIISTHLQAISGFFKTQFAAIKSCVNTVMTGIKNTITSLISTIKTTISTKLAGIKSTWNEVWTSMKSKVVSIFSGIWTFIKGTINSIIGGINGMIKGVVGGINTVIKALNTLSFTTPDWLPDGLGGKTFGFSLSEITAPQIPKLAQGGFVKANTPQLAMIGDNRHQGEIVSPEDKLREMALWAAKEAGGTGITAGELQAIIESAVTRMIAALYEMGFNLDGEQLAKAEKIIKSGLDRRYNTAELI